MPGDILFVTVLFGAASTLLPYGIVGEFRKPKRERDYSNLIPLGFMYLSLTGFTTATLVHFVTSKWWSLPIAWTVTWITIILLTSLASRQIYVPIWRRQEEKLQKDLETVPGLRELKQKLEVLEQEKERAEKLLKKCEHTVIPEVRLALQNDLNNVAKEIAACRRQITELRKSESERQMEAAMEELKMKREVRERKQRQLVYDEVAAQRELPRIASESTHSVEQLPTPAQPAQTEQQIQASA
jgi:flagellum-specific peptidoglycan hydrolase FlgJ